MENILLEERLKKCQSQNTMLLTQMKFVIHMVLTLLRMYEMFLGPIEQDKPWNTAGISGVHNFLKKFWRLFYKNGRFQVKDQAASIESLKVFIKL